MPQSKPEPRRAHLFRCAEQHGLHLLRRSNLHSRCVRGITIPHILHLAEPSTPKPSTLKAYNPHSTIPPPRGDHKPDFLKAKTESMKQTTSSTPNPDTSLNRKHTHTYLPAELFVSATPVKKRHQAWKLAWKPSTCRNNIHLGE